MTKLEKILGKGYSHDRFTKMLLDSDTKNEQGLWRHTKALLRDYENDKSSCILIDDSILDKHHTKECDMVCWHYDHTVGKSVKGICMLNFHYTDDNDISIPLGYEIITKSETYLDKETNRTNKKSFFTKNEIMQDKLAILSFHNEVKYRYVLADKWFSSTANMVFVNSVLKKKFVFPLKNNRTVALSLENKQNGNYVSIASIDMEGYDNPLKIVKQVSKNRDDDETTYLYLVTNDIDLTHQEILEIYKRRWKIEEYHKSLKQNLKIEHSPTKVEISQRSHIFLSVCGFSKLEKLRLSHKINHFALKEKFTSKL